MTIKIIPNDKSARPGNSQRCCCEGRNLRPGQHLQRIANLREPAPRAPSLLRDEGLDSLC